MFTCSKCKGEFEDSERAGKYRPCKTCRNAEKKAWIAQNREGHNAVIRAWKKANADRINAERRAKRNKAANPELREKLTAAQREYRAMTPEKQKEYRAKDWANPKARAKKVAATKQWKEQNYGRVLAMNAERRARQVTPLSVCYRDEIASIYENCPEGHHVDHIWPLKGRNFSGLHVPWNLQYLTPKENLKKKNNPPVLAKLAA